MTTTGGSVLFATAGVDKTTCAAADCDDNVTDTGGDDSVTASEARTTSQSSGSVLQRGRHEIENDPKSKQERADTYCISHHFMAKMGRTPITLVKNNVSQNVGYDPISRKR